MTETLQKKNLNRNMGILFSNLLLESIFDFRKWSNLKYAKTRICVFSVWPLPEVENWFRKHIWKENTHISILIFFLKSFGQYLKKKVKKWISHCIFKKWFDWGRVHFLAKIFSEKAKLPKLCLSFGGSMPEAQIKQCPLTPPNYYIWIMSKK